jgi:DNA-binding NarL/FixJ family response regulator
MQTALNNIGGPSVKKRIFLVEDHPVTRSGFASLLDQERDMQVCGEAGNAPEAMEAVPKMEPDVVVLDLALGGRSGVELIKDLCARVPGIRILVLSTFDEGLYAERSLRAGARGYIMKQERVERILAGIREVAAGGIFLSEAMRAKLVHKHLGVAADFKGDVEQLSDRELEVFRLLGLGHGTRRIAAELHLSVSTIETYRSNIKHKLNLPNAPELVRSAVEWAHRHYA